MALSALTKARRFNPASILPNIWTNSDREFQKAWTQMQKEGLEELFSWSADHRIAHLAKDCNRIVDQLDACHLNIDALLWTAALMVGMRWDSQGFDWTEANTFCWSYPLTDEFAVTVTGWLNRTMKHGVPVMEMKLMGLNACAVGQSVPTQVPPRSASHPDFRSFDGIHQRCEWAVHQIRNDYGEWPYGHFAITEGELNVIFKAEETDPPPASTLGDQILASAEAVGHDFDQGDYVFDERVVLGGQTYRVQGLANHAPGFAPVTQMAVMSMKAVRHQ